MKVVLTGIYYPVAILRYFEAALRRVPGIELFTAGPYSGSSIPWSNPPMHLPEKYAKPPDLVLPGGALSISTVEQKLPWKPDLWIQVDAGYYLWGKPSCPNYFVGTDPHCLNYDRQRLYADVFFCMQTPYMKSGDIWLPYAYDPYWHAPRPDESPILYDGALVGVKYPDRQKWVAELRSRGYKVFMETGPCYDEARDIYHQSRIGMNWSSLLDLCARVFEVAAMGLCPVVNRVPDLERIGFVDGVHYFGFSNLPEAVVAFGKAMKEWQDVGKRAQALVSEHTWDARVCQILQHHSASR